MNKFMEKIKEKGVLTGSYVYGGYDPKKSDIDYLVLEDDYINNASLIKNGFEIDCDYSADMWPLLDRFLSFKKLHEGHTINVLLYQDKDLFACRVLATQTLTHLADTSNALHDKLRNSKPFRTGTFKKILEVYHYITYER